jgi:hypothetical protein
MQTSSPDWKCVVVVYIKPVPYGAASSAVIDSARVSAYVKLSFNGKTLNLHFSHPIQPRVHAHLDIIKIQNEIFLDSQCCTETLLTCFHGVQEAPLPPIVNEYLDTTHYSLLGAETRRIVNLTLCNSTWAGNSGNGIGLRVVELGIFHIGCEKDAVDCEVGHGPEGRDAGRGQG